MKKIIILQYVNKYVILHVYNVMVLKKINVLNVTVLKWI